MKLDQLLAGSKSSSSSSSRAARAGGAEGKPNDFAGALIEARRKPEPRPAETERPASKGPTAKEQRIDDANDAPPTDDSQRDERDAVADDEPHALPADSDETVAADEQDTPDDADEPGASKDPELLKIDADLTAIAMIQPMGPATPVAQVAAGAADAEGTQGGAHGICPPTKFLPASAQARLAALEEGGDAPADGVGVPLEDVNAAEGTIELPLAFDELLTDDDAAAPVTKVPASPTRDAASASLPSADSGEATSTEAAPKEDGGNQQLPAVSNEFPQDAQAEADVAGPTSTAQMASDTTVTSTSGGTPQPENAKAQPTPNAPAAPTPAPPQAHFVETNHPKIITALQSQAMTNGGTMQIRLDPPELGALMVSVHMQDGIMTASFQTSNDDATKLLSHSLSQLKQVLESQGVSVEKLQVSQSPKDQPSQNDDPHQQQQRDPHGDAHRQEQQRKEMLRRMWRRLSNGSDPLDLVA